MFVRNCVSRTNGHSWHAIALLTQSSRSIILSYTDTLTLIYTCVGCWSYGYILVLCISYFILRHIYDLLVTWSSSYIDYFSSPDELSDDVRLSTTFWLQFRQLARRSILNNSRWILSWHFCAIASVTGVLAGAVYWQLPREQSQIWNMEGLVGFNFILSSAWL